jgi:hypothetical protein
MSHCSLECNKWSPVLLQKPSILGDIYHHSVLVHEIKAYIFLLIRNKFDFILHGFLYISLAMECMFVCFWHHINILLQFLRLGPKCTDRGWTATEEKVNDILRITCYQLRQVCGQLYKPTYLISIPPFHVLISFILYNVGGPWSVLITNRTVIPLRTPFGFVIPLLQSSITRNYNHSQLFLTPLHMYTAYNDLYVRNYDHLVHSCIESLLIDSLRLHWLTSQLTVTITDYHTLCIFTIPVSVSYRDNTRSTDLEDCSLNTECLDVSVPLINL